MRTKTKWIALALVLAGMTIVASQVCHARDNDDEDLVSSVSFAVLKDENGKPLRDASVVIHPVNRKGKQERNGVELKTDPDGNAKYDSVPYGKMRIQVLSPGYQTYGEDFDINQPTMQITVRMKRPSGQYSIYGDKSKGGNESKPPDNNGGTK